MKLLHGADHVRDMLDDMDGAQRRERVVAKGIREAVEIADHVGAAARIAVDADGARIFVDAAADVERACAARGRRLRRQLQTFLQCIDSEIGLIARDDERRHSRMLLRPAPSTSRPRWKAICYPIAKFGRAFFES